MTCACSRSRARIAVNSAGSTSPASSEIICPSFIAAPRIRESRSVTLRALPGVSRRSDIRGRSPRANWRIPSPIAPAATPPAICPSAASRDSRASGTLLYLSVTRVFPCSLVSSLRTCAMLRRWGGDGSLRAPGRSMGGSRPRCTSTVLSGGFPRGREPWRLRQPRPNRLEAVCADHRLAGRRSGPFAGGDTGDQPGVSPCGAQFLRT